jgi:biotin transport system substrate-specific component
MEAILKREVVIGKSSCRFIGVVAFAILTALGAYVRLPLGFTPVPLTLQTFFILLSALFLGSRLSFASQAIYIMLGIMGIPLFTLSGSGLLYLAGPTSGYLLGFLIAAILVGQGLKLTLDRPLAVFALLSLASAVILVIGTAWLKLISNLSWERALFMGFLPFFAGDIIKSWAASLLYCRFKNRIKEIF